MVQLKTYFLFFSFLLSIVFIGCQKDISTEPDIVYNNSCPLYSAVSADTNYIPHKKNSSWQYNCPRDGMAGWSASVILDTIINNKIIIDRLFHTESPHVFYRNLVYRTMIDSLGNYYQMTDQSLF